MCKNNDYILNISYRYEINSFLSYDLCRIPILPLFMLSLDEIGGNRHDQSTKLRFLF